MVTLDRIRLTGLLRETPQFAGFPILGRDRVHHRCIRARSRTATPRMAATCPYGSMFWFSRKKFVGSYVPFNPARRSYCRSPYAWRTLSAPSLPRKLR
jgi:hypothetical protein